MHFSFTLIEDRLERCSFPLCSKMAKYDAKITKKETGTYCAPICTNHALQTTNKLLVD